MNSNSLIGGSSNCCGCLSCASACPCNAISFREDDKGFVYPQIDSELCVDCRKCIALCDFKKREEKDLLNGTVFASAAVSDEVKKRSSSGGVFYILAKKFLSEPNTVVYGASYSFYKDSVVQHERISTVEGLERIQGSKYTQSFTNGVYEKIRDDIRKGIKVLFSGTPCQVAAVNAFLTDMEKENLYTVDIICHGVPSQKMFKQFLHTICKYKVERFTFRDKTQGWSQKGRLDFFDGKKLRSKPIYIKLNAYYQYFMNGSIIRDSCYNCKYCGIRRQGDITLGDYWGFEKYHSDELSINGGKIDMKKGISCIIISTSKGNELFNKANECDLYKIPSRMENLFEGNPQLLHPCKKESDTNKIYDSFYRGGYSRIEKDYYKSLGIKYYIYRIYYMLPSRVRLFISR